MTKYIGAHVSISGGVFMAPKNGTAIGATAIGMFTKNQKRWNASEITQKELENFKSELSKSKISPDNVLVHDSYLINLGHPDSEKREKSLNAFIDELERAEKLGLKLVNFHPGTHLKEISEAECIENVAQSLNSALSKTKKTIAVIEMTAGQGGYIGYKFEHIRDIINKVSDKKHVGVCIDTCHIFAGGYDIRTEENYKSTMDNFDKIVGFEYLMGMHLNDSKTDLGKRIDRHESLGKGKIGITPFKLIMNDSRIENIPLILETPDPDIWADEIKMLYQFIK